MKGNPHCNFLYLFLCSCLFSACKSDPESRNFSEASNQILPMGTPSSFRKVGLSTSGNPHRLVKFSDREEKPSTPPEMTPKERDQISGISPTEMKSLTAKQLRKFTPAQISALSFEHVKALVSPRSKASLKYLKRKQLEALKRFLSRLGELSPREQLEALTAEQFEELSKSTRKLLPRLIRNHYGHREGKTLSNRRWKHKEVLSLKPEDIGPSQITEVEMRELFLNVNDFSLELISAIHPIYIKHFWSLPFLSNQQTSALTCEQFDQLSSEQLNLLSENQIRSLRNEQKETLQNNPEKIRNLKKSFFQALFPEITTEHMMNLTENTIQDFSNLEMKAIIIHCQLLSRDQLQTIQPEQMQLFSKTDLASLRNDQISWLSPQQIEKIKPDIFNGFTEGQIPHFTKNQIQAFTVDQVKKLSVYGELVRAITPEQMTYFLPDIIPELNWELHNHL